MTEGRRVLLTGVSGQFGGLVARALEQRDDVLEIVGIDVREPPNDLRRTEFVRADLRNPLVGRVLEAAAIDTVLHLSLTSQPGAAGGRTSMKEHNVIGTMQLMAACQASSVLRRVVLKSTGAVYGSAHTDPALFREDSTPRIPPRQGFGKDAGEAEGYVRMLGRRRPDLDLTILRLANLVGPRVDSAFQSFFALPVLPTVVGFDPRLQFCHEEDAVGALVQAATGDRHGTVNVAGAGTLYLSQAIRLAGRVPVPVPLPFVSGLSAALRRSGRADVSPDQLRMLQFGRVMDTTRLREEFGFEPEYTTRAAFDDFLERRRLRGMIDRDEAVRLERELYDFLQRKGQERFLESQRAGQEGRV
ncbi:MAG: NAD-dependent epimerase/dehydratase family protein [Nitriliruptor sp.]|nr:MAG: NAD-dependent epimerase/dehydratase family protein [Nitriliruptor sp.]